jgi:thiol-disulfide isomerase/thioredoxin
VLINFWVSWCGNCKIEMNILNNLYLKYHEQGLEIIGISIDESRSRKDFKKVVYHLNYPNFMSIDAIKNDFGIPNNVPQDYLIDRSGRVFLMDDLRELDAKIEYLLR